MDDELSLTDLVQRARDGDENAWNNLVERFSRLVGSVIAGFRLRGADAEDVAQTVWLRLLEHLRQLREPKALPMWIVTTTRNECLRVLRTSRRTRPFDPTAEQDLIVPPDTAELDEQLLRTERRQLLVTAFAQLSDPHRRLLTLLIEDPPISYAQISDQLGIPVGSIGPTRSRALRRLRECIEVVTAPEPRRGTATTGGEGHDFATLGR
jgi:RNA polymerase sigma factor (sigma-70 family)